MKICLSEILKYLDAQDVEYRCDCNKDIWVEGFSSLKNYKPGTITWIKKNAAIDDNITITIVVVEDGVDTDCENVIYCKNSKKAFFSIIEAFFGEKEEGAFVGCYTYISPKVKLGNNVRIGHNCTLEGDITIGDNTVIHNGVSILNKVKIGQSCEIQSGAVIGHNDGSYYEDINNKKTMINHYGGVNIADNVYIGSNTCVCRGTMDDTCIGEGSKVLTLCHIAHNVIIDRDVALIPNSVVYGSCKIGENSYIASGIIKNQCRLGKNSIVGMGSVVMNDVDDNTTVVGIPAKELRRK